MYKFKIADFFDSKQKFVQKNRGFATFYEVLHSRLLVFYILFCYKNILHNGLSLLITLLPVKKILLKSLGIQQGVFYAVPEAYFVYFLASASPSLSKM